MKRGIVTLVFDDGYERVFTHVLPLLKRSGMRAVFAVPVQTHHLAETESAATEPLSLWKAACVRDGHELAAHGVTHHDLTRLTDDDLRVELDGARAATGATTLVYPGGAHDGRVVAEVRACFRAARTVRPGFATLPPADPWRLPSFVATKENYQVWKWNLRVLWAWLTNRWLIECYHDVSLGPDADDGKQHTIPLRLLERHLAFLHRLPIRIATIRDIVHA